jgi:hypothetical protein
MRRLSFVVSAVTVAFVSLTIGMPAFGRDSADVVQEHAGRQHRPDAAGGAEGGRQRKRGCVLVAPRRLAQPDAHAKPDAIYFMTFFNTRNGPVAFEIPPAEAGHSITANIDDIWQMPLEDAGPSGADKGKGGKYLLLPPGYADKVPKGYIALPMLTYSGYALIRSNLASHADADVASSVAYGKRVKVYAYKDRANPPPTRFTDMIATIDATILYDERFFDSLNRIIQDEPGLPATRR